MVGAVLDALSAPAGAEDTRTYAQRYHDGLQEAMRRLVAAGLLPERAGQPVKVVAHISLADLMVLDGSSALQEEWTANVRAAWAARRAAASVSGGDGGAWLDGDAATAMACDAAMTPIVTGEVNPAALEDLIRLCVDLDRLRRHGTSSQAGTGTESAAPTGRPGDGDGSGDDGTVQDDRRHRQHRRPGRAPPGYHPGVGSPGAGDYRQGGRPGLGAGRAGLRSCAAGSWARGWPGRACRWTSGSPGTSRPRSGARSSCATSTAAGPAAATSPPPPARCTI